ncbi:hypothetical protein, partial [Oscillatoria sp. HE19RPO]|uniref:hypothetical protein n=1 Tax=Oscillatoria sp. HE19RPO TaxID=2954806 RepID=UPI0020C56BB0
NSDDAGLDAIAFNSPHRCSIALTGTRGGGQCYRTGARGRGRGRVAIAPKIPQERSHSRPGSNNL